MKKYKMDGLADQTRRLIRDLSERKVSVYAATACFFLVLAVFPALLLVLGLVQYTPLKVEWLWQLLTARVQTS